jgi:hypothetical protein
MRIIGNTGMQGLVVADFALRLFVEVLWPRLQTGHRQWPLLFSHAGVRHLFLLVSPYPLL